MIFVRFACVFLFIVKGVTEVERIEREGVRVKLHYHNRVPHKVCMLVTFSYQDGVFISCV